MHSLLTKAIEGLCAGVVVGVGGNWVREQLTSSGDLAEAADLLQPVAEEELHRGPAHPAVRVSDPCRVPR